MIEKYKKVKKKQRRNTISIDKPTKDETLRVEFGNRNTLRLELHST